MQYADLIRMLQVKGITLVAVSKSQPMHKVSVLYEHGQRIFGENRAQELLEKCTSLPQDIEWHMIGHLQTNKVRAIIPVVTMIQSVDSVKLLGVINKEASKQDRVIDILLQIRIAEEPTKYGFDPATIADELQSAGYHSFTDMRYRGVMGMASFVDDEVQLHREFRLLKEVYNRLRTDLFAEDQHFDQISMGMSGDYQIAIEEGSTMVRIGSLLFGPR